MKLLPRLAHSHPGFFRVAVALLVVHLICFVDNWMAPDVALKAPVFRAQAEILPLWVFAWAHACIFALGIVGLYRNFRLARMSFLVSVTTFTLQGAVWINAAVHRHTSFIGGSLVLFTAAVAAACYMEPEENPAARIGTR